MQIRSHVYKKIQNISRYKTALGNFELFSLFWNKRVFWLVPSLSIQVYHAFPLNNLDIAKRRNDMPNGLKIMKLVEKLRKQEKMRPF